MPLEGVHTQLMLEAIGNFQLATSIAVVPDNDANDAV